mmetsp:Transcript_18806/g.28401  ORF Transcript_18806/g.28401 Transcript_18806/m.28401 type:complete len:121 (+) Transcript_18806:231-593(+)
MSRSGPSPKISQLLISAHDKTSRKVDVHSALPSKHMVMAIPSAAQAAQSCSGSQLFAKLHSWTDSNSDTQSGLAEGTENGTETGDSETDGSSVRRVGDVGLNVDIASVGRFVGIAFGSGI